MKAIGWCGLLAVSAALCATNCGSSDNKGLFSADAGTSASGGVATGGFSTGGFSTGGFSTGGFSTGGFSTGGFSTGGYSTGGFSTGGFSTGGVSGSTGGDAATSLGGAGAGGIDGAAGASATVGVVPCGNTSCSLSSQELCCVNQGVYSCETSTANCDISYACDGDEDCGSGEVCCAIRTTSIGSGTTWVRTECTSNCGGDDIPVGCRGPYNCPAGMVCCGTWQASGFGMGNYSSVQCQSTCSGSDVIFCTSDADCTGFNRCLPSQFIPADYLVCR